MLTDYSKQGPGGPFTPNTYGTNKPLKNQPVTLKSSLTFDETSNQKQTETTMDFPLLNPDSIIRYVKVSTDSTGVENSFKFYVSLSDGNTNTHGLSGVVNGEDLNQNPIINTETVKVNEGKYVVLGTFSELTRIGDTINVYLELVNI